MRKPMFTHYAYIRHETRDTFRLFLFYYLFQWKPRVAMNHNAQIVDTGGTGTRAYENPWCRQVSTNVSPWQLSFVINPI